jgi:hypothetical protein
MNVYDLLQEENQRFWDFLDLDQVMLDAQNLTLENEIEDYSVEELEAV